VVDTGGQRTCEAAVAGDPVCMHRAAVRFVLGWLTLPEPTDTAATVDCGACSGRGWSYAEAMGGRTFPDQIVCDRCKGAGQMPVRIRTLAPAPVAAAAD
jgi:hypothetical protein